MNIDRTNYEVWIIDWYDGKLTESQVIRLKAFLKEHPDLSQEPFEPETILLSPVEITFNHKKELKKSAEELPMPQFEYLCVAFLENDLNPEQTKEFLEIAHTSPEKWKTFELIQKLKLSPSEITYKHKNRLRKRTAGEKVMYLSLTGLSAAAVVLIALLIYTLIPHTGQGTNKNTTQNITPSGSLQKEAPALPSEYTGAEKETVPGKQVRKNAFSPVQKNTTAILQKDTGAIPLQDTLPVINRYDGPVKLAFIPEISVGEEINGVHLTPSDFMAYQPAADDIRSRLSRLIAKAFRQKVLKEKTTEDSPLKAYEIAEAGVSGLNKLFGWQMALEKNNNEYGELKSVYFSSKLIKFRAPVKKN